MRARIVPLALLGLLTAGSAALLATGKTDYEVSLDSVVEIWGDLLKDADHVGLAVTRVSVAREMEIGREIHAGMGARGALVDDPALQAYVARVGETLLKHVRRRAMDYRFHVLRSPVVNAYAIPGGHIYVTTGMLGFLESEAELAALLGHEISHVDLRHCIERLQYELVARKVVGKELAAIVRVGHDLVGLGFSEQQELEADVTGMIFAAKAGYDPKAAIDLFERMAKSKGEKGGAKGPPTLMIQEAGAALARALEKYFATHPPTALRVRELEAAAKRNARAWQGRQFYVGRTNYRDRVARDSEPRADEWKTHGW